MTIPISILSGRARRKPVSAMTPASQPSGEAEPVRHAAVVYNGTKTAAHTTAWDIAALAEINQALKLALVGVRFEVDTDTSTIIAKVVNLETGKLIVQMPSEEVMQLSKVLGKLHDLLVHQAICRKAQLTEQSRASAPMRWSRPWLKTDATGLEADAFRPVTV